MKNEQLWSAVRDKFPGFNCEEVEGRLRFFNLPLRKDGSAPTLEELLENPREAFITGDALRQHEQTVAARRRRKKKQRGQARRSERTTRAWY